MLLGLEIGGTKLQVAAGRPGELVAQARAMINPAHGAAGIQNRLLELVPEVLKTVSLEQPGLRIQAAGIGFGGPVDWPNQRVILSHQVSGWDHADLPRWFQTQFGIPCWIANDADVAGLAEACFGAGQAHRNLIYLTIGSGIGGAWVLDRQVYSGQGQGALEVGHLLWHGSKSGGRRQSVEDIASGFGMQARGHAAVPQLIQLAAQGDRQAKMILDDGLEALAEALVTVQTLLCPQRIILGGGVTLQGEATFWTPLRQLCQERWFGPFANRTDLVPARLGETVVLHGALELARRQLANEPVFWPIFE